MKQPSETYYYFVLQLLLISDNSQVHFYSHFSNDKFLQNYKSTCTYTAGHLFLK